MNAEKVRQHSRVVAGSCLVTLNARQAAIYDHKKGEDQAAEDLRIDGRCYLRSSREEGDEFDFIVRNAKGQVFQFLAVDKCMFTDSEGKRCDCIIFNESVTLFIEMKENKARTRKEGRKSAIRQLRQSVEWFLSEGLLAELETVEVIVANGIHKRPPRFDQSIIDRTTELQLTFPNLNIRYGELPFYKL
ncbi:hypothetical protein [Hymenobacter antarcticus]|uniref:Uncharacterized protein n=1 Tax=Hymenobacter antarcticus TaxID=486270 RepID=A0ABP7NZN3_9BACT